MKSRWKSKGLIAAVAAGAVAALAMATGPGASAARVETDRALPQTYLLKLDEAPTLRVFRQNRSDGLKVARAAARSQKTEVTAAQNRVIAGLPAEADVIYRTHSVLAGVGVNATSGDQEALEQINGVTAVYPVAPKRMENAYAVPFQAAATAWQNTGFLGQGQTIAVIDSGVDYTHSHFGGPGTVLAYEEAHANEAVAADPLLFPNEKVIGGIDLVGDDYNTTSSATNYQPIPHPDPNPLDCGGHGSHVAGSAAGYGVNADGSTYAGDYDENTDFEAMKIGPGVAPKAGIFAIKVFGCSGSTGVVTQAIDRAVDPDGDGDPSDRVDVINLSLGSDFGSVQDGDSVAAGAAVAMGVSVVAAAGNAGDITDISGSPGDESRVLSVASSVDAQSKVDGAGVTIDGTQEQYAVTRSSRYDWKNAPDLSGPVVAAPAGNETACSPYEGTPFTGKVVIVEWHDASPECASITRGDNLAAAGAAGFIFGSDAEEFSAGINGDDEIPGVLMVASGAEAIREALENDLPVTIDGTEVNAITLTRPDDNDKVSSFTSRGIHAAGNVKPDVAAVGHSIFSVAVGAGSAGTSNSGTSMASPMVAGLAALVRQANPDWSPLQVKAGIMNTAAHDLFVNGSVDPSSGRYGPPRVGSGRIDAEGATTNQVLAYDPAGGAVSVSFGPVEADQPVSLSREVIVDNQSSTTATYDVGYDPIHEVPGAEFSVTPSQVTLEPGETATVTVTLEIDDPDDLTKAFDPTVGRFGLAGYPRETLAEAFGRVLLEPGELGHTLRVPVYASPRPASTMTQPGVLRVHRTEATADGPVQSARFELSGKGVGSASGKNGKGDSDPYNDIESLAMGFELQASSGKAPRCEGEVQIGCWNIPEERFADLARVGYTSNAPLVDDPDDAMAFFAASVHGPAAIPADKSAIQFDLDVDGDDVPDLFLFNGRLADNDTFLSVLYDPAKPAGQRVIDSQLMNGRFGNVDTALYDSDVMMLPVSLAELAEYGVNESNPRINYGVEGYSYTTRDAIDLIGVNPESGDLQDPLTANLYEPGILLTESGGDRQLFRDQPGRELTLTRNIASWQEDEGKGLLMLHFHNKVGDKAQIVGLERAESATELIVAPDSISARVDAVEAGPPAPGGTVTFSVDGSEVGSAAVEQGVAVLTHRIPAGATREIEASYSGDDDFEPSSDQTGRSDPGLTAKLSSRTGKNRFGWYRFPVTVTFKCTPNGSDLTEDCPYPKRLARDGRGLVVRRTIVAFDGGRASVTVRGINIDRTPPVVRLRGIRAGASYPRIRRARCAASDRTSGLLNCQVSWVRRGKRVIYTATATDRAGNRKKVRIRVRLRR